jgi:hypothetical protein
LPTTTRCTTRGRTPGRSCDPFRADSFSVQRGAISSKSTVRGPQKAGDLPGWQIYTELFEPEDAVYLELEGVAADVTMIGSPWGAAPGTVLLRLPTATARQLGLVPPDFERDDRWSTG